MLDQIRYLLIKYCTFCNLDCSYCLIQDKKSKEESKIFSSTKELVSVLKDLPIADTLNIELTGGECTLFADQIYDFYQEMKKIERVKDTKINIGIVTNGTQLEKLFPLFDEGIIDPWSTKISWDGIYSESKSRKSKTGLTDGYFNDKIKTLGASKYNKDVLVRIALTKDIIDDLADSFEYALNAGCNKIEYYLLYLKDDPNYYANPEFLEKIRKQLFKIGLLYMDHPFDYENWNYLFYTDMIEDKSKLFDLSCEILGRMLYITIDGDIYPCSMFHNFFSDTEIFKLGDVHEGLHKDAIWKFTEEYKRFSQFDLCKSSSCGNYHCYKCPAFLYYRQTEDGIYGRYDFCRLRSIEKTVFNHYAPLVVCDEEKIRKRMDFTKYGPLTYDLPNCFRM